ncbi:hypothetical protein [Sulfurimonas sp.]|uniref:hypothetical protein n=1 Tax=Sulfurimonas sp. TaxID=2022749 RepID=UPI002604BA59|nr:hypothetical protein [Sulfurimonas sp.]
MFVIGKILQLTYSETTLSWTSSTNPMMVLQLDVFAGIKRSQLANEGSAKENIYRLLKEFQT